MMTTVLNQHCRLVLPLRSEISGCPKSRKASKIRASCKNYDPRTGCHDSSTGADSNVCQKAARWLLVPISFTFLVTATEAQQLHYPEAVGAFAIAGTDDGAAIYSKEKQKSLDFAERVSDAIALLEEGRQAQAQADFPKALLCFTQIIQNYGDLALSEYARVGRAILLYEVGDRTESFIELEDVALSLKGYPEIHAALAAALYTDKKAPIFAEKQFAIATLLDPHYTELSYVKDIKHWPPSLVRSLEKFINFE